MMARTLIATCAIICPVFCFVKSNDGRLSSDRCDIFKNRQQFCAIEVPYMLII